jgi:hypothetical protein
VLPVAGWRERADLPDLGLRAVAAKLDTGARTSALHVSAVELLPGGPDGPRQLLLTLPITLPINRARSTFSQVLVELVGHALVTDSGGHRTLRPVIETLLVLGPLRRRIRLTLTDRSALRLPLLLGRSALADSMLVDPARTYLLRRRRPRRPEARAAGASAKLDTAFLLAG